MKEKYMSVITFDLGMGQRIETVPAWPEGPWKIADFRPMYTATRQQIAHLIDYAIVVARTDMLEEQDTEQLVAWATEFFLIDVYRKPIEWRALSAVAAHRICYEHASVRLHGPNFQSEDARITSSKAYREEVGRRCRRRAEA